MSDGIPVVAHVASDERDVRGINDRAQLVAVERILQERRIAALMGDGVAIADPDRIEIRGTLSCGQDVRIDIGCVFEGDVVLGDNVAIGPYCVLRDVQRRARARPSSRSRTWSMPRSAPIAASVRTRACVPARRWTTMSTSAISSRSRRARWGAAPRRITSPMSATRRSAATSTTAPARSPPITMARTSTRRSSAIDASIGSNCVLVAPVTVGAGATIGAGSVIAQDAPADALTVARAKQISVPGWQRPVKPPKSDGKD